MFHYLTSEDIRHYVLDNLLGQNWVLMAIEKWFKQTQYVSYYTNIDIVMFHYLTSGKIRHHELGNLLCFSWLLEAIERGLSRHTVLYTPIRLIQLCFITMCCQI